MMGLSAGDPETLRLFFNDDPGRASALLDVLAKARLHRVLRTVGLCMALLCAASMSWAKSRPPRQPVPPEARVVVESVLRFAQARDWKALRKLMKNDFEYSFAASPSADDAIAWWGKRPGEVRELVATMKKGCLLSGFDRTVACPPQWVKDWETKGNHQNGCLGCYGAWRAIFENVGGTWMFAAFVEGD